MMKIQFLNKNEQTKIEKQDKILMDEEEKLKHEEIEKINQLQKQMEQIERRDSLDDSLNNESQMSIVSLKISTPTRHLYNKKRNKISSLPMY